MNNVMNNYVRVNHIVYEIYRINNKIPSPGERDIFTYDLLCPARSKLLEALKPGASELVIWQRGMIGQTMELLTRKKLINVSVVGATTGDELGYYKEDLSLSSIALRHLLSNNREVMIIRVHCTGFHNCNIKQKLYKKLWLR